jgi:phage gp16-like protein
MMMQMMTTMTQSQQQSMMQMLPLLVSTKGGGPEELDKYLMLFQKLGMKTGIEPPKETDADSDISVSEVLSNVATIVQGAPAALSALKEMAPGNGQVALPMGVHPAGEPVPGSAASVLGLK